MKKFCLLLLSSVIILMLFSACSVHTAVQSQLKENVKLSDVVNSVKTEIGITMPMDINDITLLELFHIQKEDVIEYAGLFSISASSADNFIILKTTDDKSAVVKQALEQRKADVINSFENVPSNEYNKAKASRIIQKGNYLIYICIGVAENNNYVKYLDNAVTIINSYFK